MFDLNQLRKAFGSYMTGVTVVTTNTVEDIPIGFTANSFSSVSLDPPLVLVCPAKSLSCYEVFANCKHFAINVLSDAQQDISNTFARSHDDRFAGLYWSKDINGCPLIKGSTAYFSCDIHDFINAGDHAILLGRVVSFDVTDRLGLGYASGGYFSLGLERRAAELSYEEGLVRVGAIIEYDNKILVERQGSDWRVPQILSKKSGDSIAMLKDRLAEQGVEIEIGSVYSVFKSSQSNQYYTFYRAKAKNDQVHEHGEYVDVEGIGELNFGSHAAKDMMKRYALESMQGVFRLYIGDDEEGDVHAVGVE